MSHKLANNTGKQTFQQININWSNLNRGKFARTNMNKKFTITTFKAKLNSIKVNILKPPKNKVINRDDIKIIFPYSPKKNIAKNAAAYSTL